MIPFLLLASLFAQATTYQLEDWKYELTDITEKGLNRDDLFFEMNRDHFTDTPICSNRAHVWAYDFSRRHQLRTAKVFLFYTPKSSDKWWYHTATAVNEGGQFYVMDAGWSGSPLLIEPWLKQHTKQSSCFEIRAKDTELIELIFRGKKFPTETSYGTHTCYFLRVPEGYWTPNSVAMGYLGRDATGRPVKFERTEILKSEVLSACVQVFHRPIDRISGAAKKKCKKYFGMTKVH